MYDFEEYNDALNGEQAAKECNGDTQNCTYCSLENDCQRLKLAIERFNAIDEWRLPCESQ